MRDTADEIALRFGGCDDPLWPIGRTGSGDEQVFTDWTDFVRKVCVPLVEQEDDEAAQQQAMALFRKVSPHYIAVSLYMAWKRSGLDDEAMI